MGFRKSIGTGSHAFVVQYLGLGHVILRTCHGRLTHSVEDAAEAIGIARRLAWALVRSGQLPPIRIARVLIDGRQLIEWLEAVPDRRYSFILDLIGVRG